MEYIWGEPEIKVGVEEIQKAYTNLWREMFQPSPILKMMSKEKKDMEIGGNTCHLCGASLLHTSHARTFVKNHREYEGNIVYQCGTHIYDTHNEYDSGKTTKQKRHIHVGDECLDVR